MKPKFKPGDRVKIAPSVSKDHPFNNFLNRVFVIDYVYVDPLSPYQPKYELNTSSGWALCPSESELIPEKSGLDYILEDL